MSKVENRRIALIGCGRIGYFLEQDPLRNKPCTHYGGALSAGLKINYACDINKKRLTEFADDTSIPEQNRFSDAKILLNKIHPEMVIISTWTQSHAEIAIMASENGAKIIVLEKPASYNLNKAKEMIRVCEKNNTHLIVNHERRYDPRYIKVKQMINSGKIGLIKTVNAGILTGNYRGDSEIKTGGGPFLHDGTHLVDIIRYFFGDISSVQGEFTREIRTSGFEDRAVAWMKTENNIDIFLEAGGGRDYFVFELEISGTKGKIVIGNGYQKLFFAEKSKYYTGFRDLSEKEFPAYSQGNCFTNLYKEAATILKGKSIVINSTGIDGYKALEAIHAVYLSSSKKRKTIKLPVTPSNISLKKIFNLQ